MKLFETLVKEKFELLLDDIDFDDKKMTTTKKFLNFCPKLFLVFLISLVTNCAVVRLLCSNNISFPTVNDSIVEG